jgi:hypothetical protein
MDDQSLSLALSVRSQDLKFVANELERQNAAGSPFFGKLDASHIGLMGHSLGGRPHFPRSSRTLVSRRVFLSAEC